MYQYCAERHTVYITEWLLSELSDVLSRAKFGLPVAIQTNILDQVINDSTVVSPTNDLPTDSIDPDDNNVLQAALCCNAHFLITGDAKHLLPLGQVGETVIISPREFYEQYLL